MKRNNGYSRQVIALVVAAALLGLTGIEPVDSDQGPSEATADTTQSVTAIASLDGPQSGGSKSQETCWDEIQVVPSGIAGATGQEGYVDLGVLAELSDVGYSTLEDLTHGELSLGGRGSRPTDVIAVGTVVASSGESVSSGPLEMAFTLNSVEVEESLKGAISPGSIIKVVETGGTYRPRVYSTPQVSDPANAFGKPPLDGGTEGVDYEFGEPVEARFHGVPVMKLNERYLLFLRSYEGPLANDAYRVQGIFAGKMNVNADGILSFTGPLELLPEKAIDVGALLSGERPLKPQDIPSGSLVFQAPARLQGCLLDEVTAGIRAILANED